MATPSLARKSKSASKTAEFERLLEQVSDAVERKVAKMSPAERARATAGLRRLATKVRGASETR